VSQLQSFYFLCWDKYIRPLAFEWYARWTCSIKPSLQHFQFCRFSFRFVHLEKCLAFSVGIYLRAMSVLLGSLWVVLRHAFIEWRPSLMILLIIFHITALLDSQFHASQTVFLYVLDVAFLGFKLALQNLIYFFCW
jgi:hypothetical protein